MAAKSIAYRPGPDREGLRREFFVVVGVFALLALLLVAKFLLGRVATEPVEVVVFGCDDVPLKATISLIDGAGRVVDRGATSESSGRYETRAPAGSYTVLSEVSVRETDVGLPCPYPNRATVLVTEKAPAPARVELRYPSVAPHPYKPGQYGVRK